jgi:hypothetical protein
MIKEVKHLILKKTDSELISEINKVGLDNILKDEDMFVDEYLVRYDTIAGGLTINPKMVYIARKNIPTNTKIGVYSTDIESFSLHSENPNVGYIKDIVQNDNPKNNFETYNFITIKPVKRGDIITTNHTHFTKNQKTSYIKEFIESLINDKHSEESIILAEQYQNVFTKESNEVILENEELCSELVEEINNIYKKINYLQDNTYYKESNFLNAMFNSYQDRLKDLFNIIPGDIMDCSNTVPSKLEELYREITTIEKANIFTGIANDYIALYKNGKKFTENYPTSVLRQSIKVLEGVIVRVKMLSVTLGVSFKEDVLEEGIIRDVVRTVSFKRWRNINKMNKNDYGGFMEDLEEDLDDIDTLKDKERFVNKIKDELEDAEKIVASEDFTKLVLPEYRREFTNYVTFLKRLKSKAEIKKVEK